LEEVAKTAKLTSDNLQSVGVTLSHAHVPNHPLCDAKIDDYLATEQIGAGDRMGLRQAQGSDRVTVYLPEVAKDMLKQLLDSEDEERSFCRQDSRDQLVLLVNNLGGLSGLELGGITAEISLQLQSTYAIKPVRVLSGTYMSNLNEIGFSISLLKVVNLQVRNGAQMLELLDTPAEATGWSAAVSTGTWQNSTNGKLEIK
jgi:triose/dihydroxyacetone kinase / FAD-AMP lyase (cyclizing)